MATEITPAARGPRAEVIQSRPLIMTIGKQRYQIDASVAITPLRPTPATVIPINRQQKQP
jgi:hypothetical protein